MLVTEPDEKDAATRSTAPALFALSKVDAFLMYTLPVVASSTTSPTCAQLAPEVYGATYPAKVFVVVVLLKPFTVFHKVTWFTYSTVVDAMRFEVVLEYCGVDEVVM